jgi:hypothetical protein
MLFHTPAFAGIHDGTPRAKWRDGRAYVLAIVTSSSFNGIQNRCGITDCRAISDSSGVLVVIHPMRLDILWTCVSTQIASMPNRDSTSGLRFDTDTGQLQKLIPVGRNLPVEPFEQDLEIFRMLAALVL